MRSMESDAERGKGNCRGGNGCTENIQWNFEKKQNQKKEEI